MNDCMMSLTSHLGTEKDLFKTSGKLILSVATGGGSHVPSLRNTARFLFPVPLLYNYFVIFSILTGTPTGRRAHMNVVLFLRVSVSYACV